MHSSEERKKAWLYKSLQKIRDKELKEPIHLNAATIIHDLERELVLIEKAVLFTDNEKMLQHFVYKINELKNLKNDHQSQRDNLSQL